MYRIAYDNGVHFKVAEMVLTVTKVVDMNQANAAREVRITCDAMARFHVLETKVGTLNQQVPGRQLAVTVLRDQVIPHAYKMQRAAG